ncbi:hypothetical protein ACFFNY_28720 [Paenibacillus hodogayensis]|uniref:Uncharacterized protein n=1 Tax=Paenibacillus hodogayensis TaxID=279208 RepID=A0ABV5W4S5_9BACL
MRIGAFLLGGLAGAAVVMYVQRNNPMSFMGMGSSRTHERNKTARSGKNFSSHASSGSFSESAWNGSGLDQLEKLIKKDPAVKSQVDEILHKSQESFMTQ